MVPSSKSTKFISCGDFTMRFLNMTLRICRGSNICFGPVDPAIICLLGLVLFKSAYAWLLCVQVVCYPADGALTPCLFSLPYPSRARLLCRSPATTTAICKLLLDDCLATLTAQQPSSRHHRGRG